ncbi:MAG: hypothetical protein IAF38_22725 [Bacteroidia bacterium]|nr:hypothetical protein [Bacteroidia bacterium]
MKRLSLLIFSILLSLSAIAQAEKDFSKTIAENKFVSIKKKNIPLKVFKTFGCDSYDNVGTKRRETGCTSGKHIVINWAVTDKNGLYIMSVSTCGIFSNTSFYLIEEGEKYNSGLKGEIHSFENFKKKYIEAKKNTEK